MKTTKSNLIKFAIGTFIFSFIFGSISVYSLKKARSEDPDIAHKIEAALRQHYKNDKINFNITVDDEKNPTTQTFSMPIHKIYIHTKSGSISIHTVKAKSQVTVQTDSPNYTLKLNDEKSLVVDDSNFGSSDVVVELPENFTGPALIKSDSGDIKIGNLSVAQLDVVTLSGEINLDQIVAMKTIASTLSGDININQKLSGDIAINTVSGDVDLNLAHSKDGINFTTQSISGTINNALNNQPGASTQVVVSTTSGNINIK